MKPGMSIKRDRVKEVVAQLRTLPQRDVLVGVPSTATHRSGDPVSNAVLAYVHDNGVPEMNIPARPFLLPGIRAALPRVKAYLKQAGQAALNGDKATVERALHAAGLVATSAIKTKLNEGIPPPLAESTLAGRRRRGRTGTKPLIDTGALRNSINYVLRVKT